MLARLDDDQAEAKRIVRLPEVQRAALPLCAQPDRIRADIDAKRAIVGTLQQQITFNEQGGNEDVRREAARMLLQLAAPYAGHRDFQARWTSSALLRDSPKRRQPPQPRPVAPV